MTNQPGGRFKLNEGLTVSTLNPLGAMGGALAKKALLFPIALLLLVMVSMFQVGANPDRKSAELASQVMGTAFAAGSIWLVYRLCGKRVPWWWLVLASITPVLLLRYTSVFYYFALLFREILPGNTNLPKNASFLSIYVSQFFGAGLCEESFKAIPVLIGTWVGISGASPWKERLGVREPLDGILLGAASGAGFAVYETLVQYGPNTFDSVASAVGGGLGTQVGALAQMVLVIPRMLQVLAGHAAYAGYLGYFIGLAALKPRYSWKAVLYGLIPAAGVHALWNTMGSYSMWALFPVAMLAYAGLASAILQARKISPTRADNFASTFSDVGQAAATVAGGFLLQAGGERYPLHYGVRLRETQIPGTVSAAGDGFVAEVSHNPKDPKILGIKNLSSATWHYASPAGKEVALPPGKSVKLVHGARIRFGSVDGVIE